ncbi:MAG: peptidoglycan bridge formation glycyltransferase FemA/FemB family protein [Oscillospiraceae bacterium]
MKFILNVDSKTFDDFVRNHPTKSHFMQSVAWGELSEKEKGLRAHRVGLEDDGGKLVAAALLLQRKPPLFPCYFYSPRGFVLDFSDDALLRAFTKEVCRYTKTQGSMFLKIDPDVERWKINDSGEHTDGFDNSYIIESLKSLGFKHRGFNKGFEGRQPRYTFRINLLPDDSEIDKRIVGNVMKNIKKSQRYACEVVKGTSEDVKELYRLITITSERDDFVGYEKSYYQSMFDVLDKYGMSNLYLGKVYPARTVGLLSCELSELLKKREKLKKPGPLNESMLSEQRLLREIECFEQYAKDYPDGAIISAHYVIHYGDKSWAVHAGSDKLMSETFINNRVYYEKIHDAKKQGSKLLDQFGTIGDPTDSPLRSLHEFKRQFGGNYVEFLGEFDYIQKNFWYFIYNRILPLYRKARISLKMARRKK